MLQNQRLGLGFEGALFEPIGCVIKQLTGGIDWSVENSQEVLLGEADVPMLALGEQAHQTVEVLRRPIGKGDRRQKCRHDATQGRSRRATAHAAHAKNQKS
jgi:hypothetical protein